MTPHAAMRAYARGAAHRSAREREADTFRQVLARLRTAKGGAPRDRTRAIVDAQRLWRLVIAAASDPSNRLPVELRASLISVGRSALREAAGADPNFDFLAEITANVAAGLSG